MLTGLWLAAAISSVLDVSDRTEFRLRDPGDIPGTVAMDLETAGNARLTLSSRRGRLIISYLPRLTLWDMNVEPSPPVLMQGGGVRAEWHNRFAQWWVDQQASYGGTNLTALSYATTASGQPPRVDALPVSRVIEYASSSSTLGTRVTLRKWAFEWMVGYQLSGGAGVEDQAVLPLQHGPLAEGKIDFAATRRSHFVTTLNGEEASFSSGAEDTLVEGQESWRYAIQRSTTLELAAGAAEVRVRPIEISRYAHVTYPVAEIAVEQAHASAVSDRWVARFNVRVAPVINRLFGTVDERIEATARATWGLRRTVVNVFATAQQTVEANDASAVQLIYGEVSASYPTSASGTISTYAGGPVAFDLGVRCMAQRLNAPVAPGSTDFAQASFVQGIMFVGLSFRAPPARW